MTDKMRIDAGIREEGYRYFHISGPYFDPADPQYSVSIDDNEKGGERLAFFGGTITEVMTEIDKLPDSREGPN